MKENSIRLINKIGWSLHFKEVKRLNPRKSQYSLSISNEEIIP